MVKICIMNVTLCMLAILIPITKGIMQSANSLTAYIKIAFFFKMEMILPFFNYN
jgi:hypothetical protein